MIKVVLMKVYNKISLQSRYLKTIKKYINSSIEDSEVVLVFGRNNESLGKLLSFVWTDKWLICPPKCHVSYEVCIQLWTAFFVFLSGLSDNRINYNRISADWLYISLT
jgi:hypothetical protein